MCSERMRTLLEATGGRGSSRSGAGAGSLYLGLEERSPWRVWVMWTFLVSMDLGQYFVALAVVRPGQ